MEAKSATVQCEMAGRVMWLSAQRHHLSPRLTPAFKIWLQVACQVFNFTILHPSWVAEWLYSPWNIKFEKQWHWLQGGILKRWGLFISQCPLFRSLQWWYLRLHLSLSIPLFFFLPCRNKVNQLLNHFPAFSINLKQSSSLHFSSFKRAFFSLFTSCRHHWTFSAIVFYLRRWRHLTVCMFQ